LWLLLRLRCWFQFISLTLLLLIFLLFLLLVLLLRVWHRVNCLCGLSAAEHSLEARILVLAGGGVGSYLLLDDTVFVWSILFIILIILLYISFRVSPGLPDLLHFGFYFILILLFRFLLLTSHELVLFLTYHINIFAGLLSYEVLSLHLLLSLVRYIIFIYYIILMVWIILGGGFGVVEVWLTIDIFLRRTEDLIFWVPRRLRYQAPVSGKVGLRFVKVAVSHSSRLLHVRIVDHMRLNFLLHLNIFGIKLQ